MRAHSVHMSFTQHQARNALSLSVETFRHWRKAMPYLGARSGRQARFSFGDLVVLGALKVLVNELGLSIGQFSASAQKFFEDCNALVWIDARSAYALVRSTHRAERPRSGRDIVPVVVSVVHQEFSAHLTHASIVVPLDPIAYSLRRFFLSETTENSSRQIWLALPPVAMPESWTK